MSQYIDVRVSIDTDMKSAAVAKSEELLLDRLINEPYVESAVILRNNGFAHLLPDEKTRVNK